MKATDLSPSARKTAEAIAAQNGLTVAEVLRYIATISRPQSNAKMKRIFFADRVSKHPRHAGKGAV